MVSLRGKTNPNPKPTIMLSFRIGGSSFRDFKKSLRVQASPGTRLAVAVAQVSQVSPRNHSKSQYAVTPQQE